MKKEVDVEKSWEHWKEFILNEDGSVNMENLKNEIADLDFVLSQVGEVYCTITGNKLSKAMYYADTIIGLYEDEIQDAYDRGYSDAKEDLE